MSFWELFVVGIIALIILGPERLPKAARTVGLWVGKAKQGFNSMKTEIDRELKVQEIRQQLESHKEKLTDDLGVNSIQDSIKETQNELKESIEKVSDPIKALSEKKAESTQQLAAEQHEPTKPKD